MRALTLVLAVSLGPIAFAQESTETPEAPRTLRVVTYNVHGFGPVASTDGGKNQIRRLRKHGQILDRFALELQLLEADVIALQEAVPESKVAALARRLEMQYRFFPGGWKGKGWPKGIAGAVLTRHAILESQDCPLPKGVERDKDLFSRYMGRVLLDVHGTQVAVFTAHLLPSWKNTTHIRLREIATLAEIARKDRESGRAVVVLGDMNHRPGTREHRAWIKAGMTDAFGLRGTGKGWTCPAQALKERIDYVWVSGVPARRILACREVTSGSFVVRAADPRSFALSDHVPVVAEIRVRD